MEAKIILLGQANTGKSSLLMRFTKDQFKHNTVPTIGVECGSRSYRSVKLNLWDVTGHDRFRSVVRSYYRGAHGCLLVCDQSDRTSFKELTYWLKQVRDVEPNVVAVLACNKSDRPSEVSDEELEAFCDEQKVIGWYRVSAKTGSNVQIPFQRLAEVVEIEEIEKELEEKLPPLPRRSWCSIL